MRSGHRNGKPRQAFGAFCAQTLGLGLGLGLALGLLPSLAGATPAGQVSCRNAELEISCGQGKCTAAESFTPMAVTLGMQGRLSVCAYSGCWEGRARMRREGRFRIFTGIALEWTGTTPGRADFAVIFDTSDRVAILKGAGFAHPLVCE